MPRTDTAHNAAESAKTVTRPHWLVQFGFTPALSVVRISSRKTVTFDGQVWTGVSGFQLGLSLDGLSGNLRFFDEAFAIFPKFIAQGAAGIPVTVFKLFGEQADWDAIDDDTYFEGELGPSSDREGDIVCTLNQPGSVWAPRYFITQANGFNHLPPDGTEITTPSGVIVLRKVR